MYTATPYRRMPNTLTPYMGMQGLRGLGVDSTLTAGLVGGGVSAAVSLASTALGSWLADKRASAMAKTYSTTIVNDLEPLLNANKNAYLSGPGTCADQAAALTAFDSAMQWLQTPQACGNLQLGAAGQNCINDRLPGGKWDWYRAYRDPIANDPRPQCNLAADAAEQAAVANLLNKISGSNVQVNANQFQDLTAGSNSTSGSQQTGTTVGTSTTGYVTTGDLLPATIGGIPSGYVLMGAGAILVIALLT